MWKKFDCVCYAIMHISVGVDPKHLYWKGAYPMHQPSIPLSEQLSLTLGFSCMTILVPGGASVGALKSKEPWTCACAESFGFTLEPRSRLSDNMLWGINLNHKCIANSLWKLDKPAIKWFVKVWMALSIAFRLCICGGTSWYFSSTLRMKFVIACEHSLSKMWSFYFNPLEVSILWMLAYTVANSEAVLDFIGSAMILLESA